MDNARYTIALSVVFGLVTIVTCLLVLVVLMIVTGLRLPSLQALPVGQPAVSVVTAAAPAVTVRPTVRMDPTLILRPPTSTPVFLSTPVVPLVRPTRLVTVTPTQGARPRVSPTKTGPSPTPTLPGNIQYVIDGQVTPDVNRPCMGGSIYGRFRDADGKPVAGMRVKVYNEYITEISAPSKPAEAPDGGYYDFIINPKPQKWTVVVVDGAGGPISAEVDVVRPEGSTACYFEVNWRKVR